MENQSEPRGGVVTDWVSKVTGPKKVPSDPHPPPRRYAIVCTEHAMKSPTRVPPVPGGRARLKNVIVVMEWVPDHGALTLEEAPAAPSAEVTAAQTANLRTTFDTRPLEGDGGGGHSCDAVWWALGENPDSNESHWSRSTFCLIPSDRV